MQHRIAEPPVQLLAATVAGRHRILVLAGGTIVRAFDADVEMVVVLPIGPYLLQPGSVGSGPSQSFFLIAALTKTRSASGSSAAALMMARCAGVQTLASTSLRLSATTMVADISSRSCRVSSRSGIGRSQMSASSPTWWLAWPVSIGPPRGCAMSPINSPCQPTLAPFCDRRSMYRTRLGCPQLRLRESRMTCQVGPLIGSASPPARQPLA